MEKKNYDTAHMVHAYPNFTEEFLLGLGGVGNKMDGISIAGMNQSSKKTPEKEIEYLFEPSNASAMAARSCAVFIPSTSKPTPQPAADYVKGFHS